MHLQHSNTIPLLKPSIFLFTGIYLRQRQHLDTRRRLFLGISSTTTSSGGADVPGYHLDRIDI